MREEIRKINKLVAEGKLSPEDAAELIDAFYAGQAAAPNPPQEPKKDEPPLTEEIPSPEERVKETVRSFVQGVDRFLREGSDNEALRKAKDAARKGVETIKQGFEDLAAGKVTVVGGPQGNREVTKTLSVTALQTLRIENATGGVTVRRTEGESTVTARAKFRASDPEEARRRAEGFDLAIENGDHLVTIRQAQESGTVVEIEVALAEPSAVEVRVEAGDVTIEGTRAPVRVTNRQGSIRLREVSGPVEITDDAGDILVEDADSPSLTIESKSSDITLRRVRGTINARTASGDVEATGCEGKVISVESVSGDVRVEAERPGEGTLNVRTVSGSATVAVGEGADARVSLSTLRGALEVEVELGDLARTEQRATGTLGEGRGTLDVSSVTGDVALRRLVRPS